MKYSNLKYIIAIFVAVSVAFGGTAKAETFSLIKDGEIVARATALWNEGDSKEIQDRLLKLSILMNHSLTRMTGKEYSYEEFGNIPNHIRIRVTPTVSRDSYAFWVVDAECGKELRISGNNLEHTERAVHFFMRRYMNLKLEQIASLDHYIERLMKDPKSVDAKALDSLLFSKVENLNYNQDEMEVRAVRR